MNSLSIHPRAKLNLGLHVTGRRDDGFHDIETLFARLELHDELTVAAHQEVKGEIAAAPGIQLGRLVMDSDNLVVRAVQAFRQATGLKAGAHLRLLKRIPLAAGLGGGSSDAVAALRAMAELHPTVDLSEAELEVLALGLGSDLPFFLSDLPAAWGSGRGERLERAELPPLHVVLLNPGVAVSASEAYGLLAGFDPPIERELLLAELFADGESAPRNTLQAGVVEEYPVIGEALDALRETGLRGVMMSGSGPTCFGLATNGDDARRIAEGLRERYPEWWVWAGQAGI